MSVTNRRLQKGDWVLVTGANGYIASHIVDVLLEEGLNVRGSLRSEKPWLNKFFADRHGAGRFETVIVPSMEDEVALENAMKGVSGVEHVAAAVQFSAVPDEVIPVVVAGTVMVMKVAAKQPSIKSVVLTSSSSAALVPEPNKHAVVDENTWNDVVVQAVNSGQLPKEILPFAIYAASKTEGERAAWAWYHANKPQYAFNAVLPNFNMGMILAPEIPGSTMSWIRDMLDGKESVNFLQPQWFVDVKDVARVHVAGLLDPSVQSRRLFAYAAPFTINEVIATLQKLRPNNTNILKPRENEGRDLTEVTHSKREEKLIKDFFGVPGWVTLADSIAAGIEGHD